MTEVECIVGEARQWQVGDLASVKTEKTEYEIPLIYTDNISRILMYSFCLDYLCKNM